MTAFLKIDDCLRCRRSLPWQWIPIVRVNGKALAGTGVWRSTLIDGHCSACRQETENARCREEQTARRRNDLIELLGGAKPYREFTFERYEVTPGNRLAFERCHQFNPAAENLYLWGPCGVGKTHLAYAAARRCFEESLSVGVERAGQLSRRARLQGAEHEQGSIDEWVGKEVLVLDAVGSGPQTAYSRQLLLDILDGRDFADRHGLIVTSALSLDDLAALLQDDAIPSRIAEQCGIIEIRESDHRLKRSHHYTEEQLGI